MKKLLTLLTCAAMTVSLRAAVIYGDSFNYTNGPIIVTSTNGTALNGAPAGSTNWFHTGTATATDFYVNNQKAEISSSSGTTVSRSEDVHCNFTTSTNANEITYASFTVRCTNLPPATGTYFAHFLVATANIFHARVFAQSPAGVLPGTWRLGISGANSTVNKILPIDLATNVDYQVVVEWDPVTLLAAKIWVNPILSTDPDSGFTGDAVTASSATVPLSYGFRQASGFGNFFCTISNLAVASTFEEAQTNVWSTNAVAPIIVNSPSATTNFIGDTVNLFGLAAGQGQGNLTYTWLKNGSGVVNPNGNSNVLSFTATASTDSGNYRLVATTPFGLSATSAIAFLWVTNAPIPPTITPTNNSTVVGYYHTSASLSVSASGPPPISYQWYYTNAPASGATISDPTQPTLTIGDVLTNNGTEGAYYCVASNPYGSKTSGVFTVTASAPPAVSIAYLRTLVDTANYNATNQNLRWQATGIVTTYTNITTVDTASYYLQDGTAGINIFTTFGSTLHPNQGDVVTFVGLLSSFNSTLELYRDTNDLSTSYTVWSNNIAALPAPMVIPFNITNNLPYCEYTLEGRTVMLTNVYFGTNAGLVTSGSANTVLTVTNAGGETFTVLMSFSDMDITNKVIPAFAYSVVGIFNQNLGNGTSPRNQGYQVEVTRFSDIVTDAPPAVTLTAAHSGHNTTLGWTDVAHDPVNYSYGSNYAYTVLASQPSLKANLSGANEVPANGSTATGLGRVTVSPDGSTMTVDMSFSGLSAPATAAHIHGPAGAGTNASVLFPFSGVPSATSGSIPQQTFALTPTQAGYLYSGLLYMNVHNANFPGGEIRDQLRVAPPNPAGPYVPQSIFQAPMLGVNEVPANGSTATGYGSVVLSPDQTTITVNMSFAGLTAPATASHIHGPGGAGTNASVLFPFSGVPSATSGSIPEQTFAITPTQVGYLQAGYLYMNVHTANFPGGEIRAQLTVAPVSSTLTFTNAAASYLDRNAAADAKFYKVVSP
jgi:carbon monoxide dehydrogenase subunit G